MGCAILSDKPTQDHRKDLSITCTQGWIRHPWRVLICGARMPDRSFNRSWPNAQPLWHNGPMHTSKGCSTESWRPCWQCKKHISSKTELDKDLEQNGTVGICKGDEGLLGKRTFINNQTHGGDNRFESQVACCSKKSGLQTPRFEKKNWKEYTVFESGMVHRELNVQYKFDPPIDPKRVDKYLSGHLRTSCAVWKAH